MQNIVSFSSRHAAIERTAMSFIDRVVSSGASVSAFEIAQTKCGSNYLKPIFRNGLSEVFVKHGISRRVSTEALGISLTLLLKNKYKSERQFSTGFLPLYREALNHVEKENIFRIICKVGDNS